VTDSKSLLQQFNRFSLERYFRETQHDHKWLWGNDILLSGAIMNHFLVLVSTWICTSTVCDFNNVIRILCSWIYWNQRFLKIFTRAILNQIVSTLYHFVMQILLIKISFCIKCWNMRTCKCCYLWQLRGLCFLVPWVVTGVQYLIHLSLT